MGSSPAAPPAELPPGELPPRPQPPEPGDCCGGGCARCVFDVYDEMLERWQRQVDEIIKQREQAR